MTDKDSGAHDAAQVRDNRDVKLYHVSPRQNRESILAHGLDPALGRSPWTKHEKNPHGTFFFPNADHVERYLPHIILGSVEVSEVDVFEVEVDESELLGDPLMTAYFYAPDPIPADRVRLLRTLDVPGV